MNIMEKLGDMNLNFKVGVKWQDPEYLGLAYVQCVALAREWRGALIDVLAGQSVPQQDILLANPAKQLEWIKAIEDIGAYTQLAVNSLDFEKAQVVVSRFQELLLIIAV